MTFRNYFRLLAEGRYKGWEVYVWRPVLAFASGCYSIATGLRRMFYERGILKPKILPIPVVSVGNITWGGVGKTPLVMYISRFFLNEKYAPLILTRGLKWTTA